jgi:hypothetical protein
VGDLAAFLSARYDDDEATARSAAKATADGEEWQADPDPEVWGPGAGTGVLRADGNGVAMAIGSYAAEHIARHDPARALRQVAADRAVLDRLERAARYRDQVFAQDPPRSVSDEMRAVTTMLTLEAVVKFRATVYAGHPDYDPEWA